MHGKNAYAIDLEFAQEYRGLMYYLEDDATATSFASSSVAGMSLQCAYEMFRRDDDVELLVEARRILREGAKLVITPLYMHTHYCAYATPEF